MIDLSHPIRSERVRGFQPPWRTVFIYQCPECKEEVRVFANSFRGKTPVPSVGGITCPKCEYRKKYGFNKGDKVTLREDVLQRHARSVPAHLGYTHEQFQWRDTLRRLIGLTGTVTQAFAGSKHVNVTYEDETCIGIESDELVLAK